MTAAAFSIGSGACTALDSGAATGATANTLGAGAGGFSASQALNNATNNKAVQRNEFMIETAEKRQEPICWLFARRLTSECPVS
jgi:hypothetical protein